MYGYMVSHMVTAGTPTGTGTTAVTIDMVIRARSGDPQAMREVMRATYPLAQMVARMQRRRQRCGDVNEMANNAILGVPVAIRGWNPDLGAWSTWAVRILRTFMMRAYWRSISPVDVPEYQPANHPARGGVRLGVARGGGGVAREVEAPSPSPEAVAVARDQCAKVEAAVALLPRRLRAVLGMRMDGLTLEEIGEVFDCSREAVRQQEEKGLDRVRRMLWG